MNNQGPSHLLLRIRAARETHAKLRAVPPTSQTVIVKRPLYESLKSLLDELWVQTQQITDQRVAASLRSAIRGLTVDCEYFAGVQAEAEGYRNAADVSDQYDLLQHQFATNRTIDDP